MARRVRKKFDFGPEAELTNQKLAGELAKLTVFTEEELQSLLPSKADKERLRELMEIVNGSARRNLRVASLRRNIGELGEVVMKVLEKTLG